jgi:hypothetical protein
MGQNLNSENNGGGAASGSGCVIPRAVFRGSELKVASQSIITNFASVSSAVAQVDLSTLITQGLDVFQRIGRAVHVHYVEFCGQLVGGQANVVADDNRNTARVSLLYANPGGVTSSNYNVGAILDPRFMTGLERVYYDEVFSLASPGRDSTGYLPACALVSRRVPVNKTLTWVSNAWSQPNTLILCACSDSAIVPNPGFTAGALLIAFTDA